MWDLRQRRVVLGILVVVLGILVWRYATRGTEVPAPLSGDGARAGEIVAKIDPNTAAWHELALLPGVGEKKAKEIVRFREEWGREHAGERAFKRAEDLMQVKGIGEGTVGGIGEFLQFEEGEAVEEKGPDSTSR